MSGAASLVLPCLQGLTTAINKHLEQALVAKQQGQSHWWKIHEACMLVLPLVGQGVVNGNIEYDIQALMNNVILPDMSCNGELIVLFASVCSLYCVVCEDHLTWCRLCMSDRHTCVGIHVWAYMC